VAPAVPSGTPSFTSSGTAVSDNTSVASGSGRATNDSVASGRGIADRDSVASGDAVARNGSVASGCSTAIDDSTASGADCAPVRVVTVATPGGTTPGAGTAARTATTGQLARTGADLDALAASAAASVVMGGVFLALGRRRKPVSA
jgi:hypothetical protein